MADKRSLILHTAEILFIELGIKGATIAQIAERAGIAKGSVYSYFKSKMDIVKALFVQSFEESQQAAEALLSNSDMTGLTLLQAHIVEQLNQVKEERAFQQMCMTDDSMVMDEDLMALVQSCRAEFFQLQLAILTRALGEASRPWQYDLLTLINGQIQQFSVLIIMDSMEFSHAHCAEFISQSAHWTLQGLIEDQSTPVLTEQTYVIQPVVGGEAAQRQRLLKQMRAKCSALPDKDRELALQTLELIEHQCEQSPANAALLRALIANLRPYCELADERAKLADLLEVELI